MWCLLLLLACTRPDPDARLRAHDLDGAAAAWEKRHGTRLDVDHPVADVLATRAARDPSITAATVADTMEAVRALEASPRLGARDADVPFERWEDLLVAAGKLGEPPLIVAVGRSEGVHDKDPWTAGGDLPFRDGRVVGWARRAAGEGTEALAALGRRLDANPPAKLVTVALRDARGAVAFYARKEADGWWVRWTTDPEAAGALLRLMEAGRGTPG
ncbi:MAG: hypothetical protein ACOZNI_02015 [Myxococcota bacterium]